MTVARTDFKASISITNPSPVAKVLQNSLPSNYTRDQNTNVYALMYGVGYAAEKLKQTNGQMEANNYIYSPSNQSGEITVNGPGTYMVEFDVPYVVPPLNVSVSGSANTDCYIEFTSRFGLTITVLTQAGDILHWTATGSIGAATDEFLGDALYSNFGTVLGLSRFDDTVIDDTFVRQYEKVSNHMTVNAMIPVQNFAVAVDITKPNSLNAPPGPESLRGRLRKTSVVTTPSASHELVDANGNIIALIAFNGSNFPLTRTTTDLASAFLSENLQARYFSNPTHDPIIESKVLHSTFDVYVSGSTRAVQFNRWDQLSYQQEVFRADNKYRRLLSGVNRALSTGPNVEGVATVLEAILAQPYIPQEYWESSDFRIFSKGATTTQYEGTQGSAPIVQIKQVVTDWTPETLTYAGRPITANLPDVPEVTVTRLNAPTSFDLTNEIIRALRIGIDVPEGGIINWNWLSHLETLDAAGQAVTSPYFTTGVTVNGQTYEYNYVFLNSANDSIASLSLFYYQTQVDQGEHPVGYQSKGPLVLGHDYFIVNTSDLYDPTANGGLGGYKIPSELLLPYNANSTLPFLTNYAGFTVGTNYINADTTKPALPSVILRIDLAASGYNVSSKFPVHATDLLIYSYARVSCAPGVLTGSFDTDPNNSHLISYYDSQSAATVQPSNSPFTGSNVQLAQGSFARITSETGYKFITTMVGGQITFNKTITVANLLQHTPNPAYGPCGIPVIKILAAGPVATTSHGITSVGQFFNIQGRLVKNTYRTTPYFQIENAEYILIDQYNYPVAIVGGDSIISISSYFNSNYQVNHQEFLFSGLVGSIIWDTRIAATSYQDTSPVFQVSNNFEADMSAFTPDVSVPAVTLPANQNFMALIRDVPLGNQQTVTASWTFNIIQQKSQHTVAQNGIPALAFPDFPNQAGIMSYFTGKKLLNDLGIDPDSSTYTQTYVSPQFDAYFIGYRDMLKSNYGSQVGGQLGTNGDGSIFDTVTNPYTTPGNMATVLNFFNPQIGVFSTSVIPGMEFYHTQNSTLIPIVRPRNKGIALQIKRGSYGGLVFYGQSLNQNVDKPTRMLLDFSFAASQKAHRHRVLEIEDNNFAGWVDGSNPGSPTARDSRFFIAGDQYKYSADGYDQADNSYTYVNGNPVFNGMLVGNQYSLTSTPPAYEVSAGDTTATPGIPQRYRRPPVYQYGVSGRETPNTKYYNTTPEKIAFFKFNLDALPIDTLLKNATMEVYFCSGFTIRKALDKNFTLSYNDLWKKSRLSGNGKTQNTTLLDPQGQVVLNNAGLPTYYKTPLQNVHWRKNFFEVIIPYAFESNFNYDFTNIFNPTSISALNTVQTPKSALEYLGFINLDEIGVQPLDVAPNVYIESTQGLSSLLLSGKAIVWKVSGSLTSDNSGAPNVSVYNAGTNPNGLPTTTQWASAGLPSSFRHYDVIEQVNLLPNMKVIVFPFGISDPANPQLSEFIYGYIKSVLPSSPVGFDSKQIGSYKNLLEYIVPLYAQYNVKLLESDTYFPFMTFGRDTTITGTALDVSF